MVGKLKAESDSCLSCVQSNYVTFLSALPVIFCVLSLLAYLCFLTPSLMCHSYVLLSLTPVFVFCLLPPVVVSSSLSPMKSNLAILLVFCSASVHQPFLCFQTFYPQHFSSSISRLISAHQIFFAFLISPLLIPLLPLFCWTVCLYTKMCDKYLELYDLSLSHASVSHV